MAKSPTPTIKASDTKEEAVPVVPTSGKATVESTNPTEKDTEKRLDDVEKMVLARTGAIAEDVQALVAELEDQVATEAKAEEASAPVAGADYDALTLERRDHARTMAKALGLRDPNAPQEDLAKIAQERNTELQKKTLDTSKDNVHNSKPTNWVVESVDAETVKAHNIVTGKTFEGPASELHTAMSGSDTKEG